MIFFTYVLRSAKDGKWYTGATSDLQKRFKEHRDGEVQSTKGRGPLQLIYYEACTDEHDAFEREKYLKSGFGKRYLKSRLKRFLSLTGQVKKVYPVGVRGRPGRPASNGGFIALMSAVIISAILLIVATTGGLTGFFGRSNILDSELKDRSAAAADACADQALLLIANDSTYTGLTLLSLNSLDSCRVLVSGAPQKNIRIQATSSNAVTNLQINYDPVAPAVVSWQEIPVF